MNTSRANGIFVKAIKTVIAMNEDSVFFLSLISSRCHHEIIKDILRTGVEARLNSETNYNSFFLLITKTLAHFYR